MGRPTKYNEQVIKDVCQALSSGAPIKFAAPFAGISETAYYEYCNLYPEFAERTTKARMGQAVRNLALIQQAAASDWRAAAEALRLSWPADFGKMAVEHSGNVNVTTRSLDLKELIEQEVTDPDARRRIAQKLIEEG